MGEFALPCVVCGKPLKNIDDDGDDNQPGGGTEFVAAGHYGSTIHDFDFENPDDPMHLVVNLCDTCILRAIDAGTIQGRSKEIALSRHPITDQQRAWVLAQNYKHYGAAHGEDEVVDYDALMLEAGWPPGLIREEDR